MHRDPKTADAAHAMTTLLRYHKRAGRFGREVRSEEAETHETRTAMESDGASERSETAQYVVDADAVAAAIVDRLLAGRTLQLPSSAPR
jgi:hypothetical protein